MKEILSRIENKVDAFTSIGSSLVMPDLVTVARLSNLENNSKSKKVKRTMMVY